MHLILSLSLSVYVVTGLKLDAFYDDIGYKPLIAPPPPPTTTTSADSVEPPESDSPTTSTASDGNDIFSISQSTTTSSGNDMETIMVGSELSLTFSLDATLSAVVESMDQTPQHTSLSSSLAFSNDNDSHDASLQEGLPLLSELSSPPLSHNVDSFSTSIPVQPDTFQGLQDDTSSRSMSVMPPFPSSSKSTKADTNPKVTSVEATSIMADNDHDKDWTKPVPQTETNPEYKDDNGMAEHTPTVENDKVQKFKTVEQPTTESATTLISQHTVAATTTTPTTAKAPAATAETAPSATGENDFSVDKTAKERWVANNDKTLAIVAVSSPPLVKPTANVSAMTEELTESTLSQESLFSISSDASTSSSSVSVVDTPQQSAMETATENLEIEKNDDVADPSASVEEEMSTDWDAAQTSTVIQSNDRFSEHEMLQTEQVVVREDDDEVVQMVESEKGEEEDEQQKEEEEMQDTQVVNNDNTVVHGSDAKPIHLFFAEPKIMDPPQSLAEPVQAWNDAEEDQPLDTIDTEERGSGWTKSNRSFVLDVINKITMEHKEKEMDEDVNRIMQEAEEALLAAQLALGAVDGGNDDDGASPTILPRLERVRPKRLDDGDFMKKTTGRFVRSLWKRIKWEDE